MKLFKHLRYILPILLIFIAPSYCTKMLNVDSYKHWLNNIADNAYISLVEPEPGDRTITILEINADTGDTLSTFVARFRQESLPLYLSEVAREYPTRPPYQSTTTFSSSIQTTPTTAAHASFPIEQFGLNQLVNTFEHNSSHDYSFILPPSLPTKLI